MGIKTFKPKRSILRLRHVARQLPVDQLALRMSFIQSPCHLTLSERTAYPKTWKQHVTDKLKRITIIELEIRVSQNLAKLGGIPEGVGGGRRNEVNHVTGEGGSNIGSWDVLNLLWIKFEPSALALKRIFWDVNGVSVVSECCIGPIPCSPHLTFLHV